MREPMRLVIPALFALVIPSFAVAEVHCEDALVQDTYQTSSGQHLDWQLAKFVTENQWKQASHNGAISGWIYGVPTGASYSDFEKNVHTMSDSESASLNSDQFQNIVWTYLGPNAEDEYSKCVEDLLNQDGLHVAVIHATSNDVTVKVSWRPRGEESTLIKPSWSWVGKASFLPVKLYAGSTDIVVARPQKDQTLAVNYKGTGDSIPIDPINLPPPHVRQNVVTVVSKTSDAEPSGPCAHWSNWFTITSDAEPADWKLISSNFVLSGDRACGRWARCKAVEVSQTSVSWQFQMQGHSEECSWHNHNTGEHDSRGTLETVWSHPDTELP